MPNKIEKNIEFTKTNPFLLLLVITGVSVLLIFLLSFVAEFIGLEENIIPFSEIAEKIKQGQVASITERGIIIEVLLKDGIVLYSKKNSRNEDVYGFLDGYGLDNDDLGKIHIMMTSILPGWLIKLLSIILPIGIYGLWLLMLNSIIKKSKSISAEDRKYKALTYLGFGLVTYCIIVFLFFYAYLLSFDISNAFGVILNPVGYLLYLTFDGWIFAIPALIFSGIGLFKYKYMNLNISTTIIAFVILLWSFYSLSTGGAWFA